MARMMKADDDVNVLCLASDFTQNETAWQIAKAFLETKFKHQEKYLRRIQKVKDYENKNYPSN
jgi:ribose 5-phosphate isomerase RpiB